MQPKLWVPEGFRELVGDNTWKKILRPYIEGDDIICRGVAGTRWGGADDGMDSGMTASGVDTKGNPTILGVSLPMRLVLKHGTFDETAGSPIPHLPWNLTVRVHSPTTGKSADAPLIDIGPAKWTGNAVDLSNQLVKILGLTLAAGEYLLDYRILKGAQWVVP